MKPLRPEARSLIEAASGGDEPSQDDAVRVRAKLAIRLATAAAAAAAATTVAKIAEAGGAAGVAEAAASAETIAGAGTTVAGEATTTGGAAGGATTPGAGAALSASGGAANVLASAASVPGATKLAIAVVLVGGAAATGAFMARPETPTATSTPASMDSAARAHPDGRQDLSPDAFSHPRSARPPSTTVDERGVGSLPNAPAATGERTVTSLPNGSFAGSKTAASARRAEAIPHSAGDVRPPPLPPALPEGAGNPPSTASKDPVIEEAALLRAAHASLSSGDGAAALARLDEHAARFPRGALSDERQAARVLALCATGRPVEARAAASAFVAASPRSPLAVQVRRACAMDR